MAKECDYPGCTNKRWGGGYCKLPQHQKYRTDYQWEKKHGVTNPDKIKSSPFSKEILEKLQKREHELHKIFLEGKLEDFDKIVPISPTEHVEDHVRDQLTKDVYKVDPDSNWKDVITEFLCLFEANPPKEPLKVICWNEQTKKKLRENLGDQIEFVNPDDDGKHNYIEDRGLFNFDLKTPLPIKDIRKTPLPKRIKTYSNSKQKKNITNYKKVYITFFNYSKEDYIPCEFCKKQSIDIHHIDNKGMGGSKEKDYIENLIALCREHHDQAHKEPIFNKVLRILHLENIIKILKNGKLD